MNIKQILQKTENFFKKHDISQPRLDAEVLLADLLHMERIKLYVNYDYPLTAAEISQYRERVKKRSQQIPVAYITGCKEFMSLDFTVNGNVLLPRPETELLVEELLDLCEKNEIEAPNIVDVGTGSGVIMVSLGYYLEQARIVGIDISAEALAVARKNIKKYEMEDRLKLIKGDLLTPLINMGKDNVDIVVSNPPYISDDELKSIPPDVKNEPQVALAGGPGGLEIYKKLIPQSRKVLKPRGLLALEIGYNQAGKIKELMAEHWQNIRIKKDYAGKDRIITARTEKNI